MAEPAPDVQNNEITTGGGGITGKGFRPGASGNPSGRPKGLSRKVREILGDDDGETIARFWAGVLTGYVAYVEPAQDGKPSTTTYERVAVNDRIAVSKLLSERGWGKPPQFAPIEDDDPLELSERASVEIAAQMDARIDELAARRRAHEQPEAAPAE